MDFFYRHKPWYAGQFVRQVIPKIELTKNQILYFSVTLNKLKPKLLSVLVRDVDHTFTETEVILPTKNNQIDFDFMESFIAELEAERIAELEAYLTVTGLKDVTLTDEEIQVLEQFEKGAINWREFTYTSIFNQIKQGRRLKKDDQIAGDIPFVMSGTTNTGVINYISNPVASFPKNSITIDIFGNAFYRNYDFGAGDDTGVYWSTDIQHSKETMLFFTSALEKSISGKFSYGNKLRSSQSLQFKVQLPEASNKPDYFLMETLVSAVQKLVIKDVVAYADEKIVAHKEVIDTN